MFGEEVSESPRAPSPWAKLISTPPSPAHGPVSKKILIPRLVPEAEDGNIEYKLQLLNPSSARFARLVTQLKWRLLEGGGQAYYELGVADSGTLIGLPRAELERTLETLEMMAGEIGASVIVVKEIEVPAIMAELGMVEESAGIASNGAAGFDKEEWVDIHRRHRRGRREGEEDDDSSRSTEFELTSTDTDTDDYVALPSHSSSTDSLTAPFVDVISVDLEIYSVYKPRPVRRRPPHMALSGKRKGKRLMLPGPQESSSGVPQIDTSAPEADSEVPTKQHAKAAFRRLARDRRREEKRKARAQEKEQAKGTVKTSTGPDDPANRIQDPEVEDLTSSLATLHASVYVAPVPAIDLDVTPTTTGLLSDTVPATDDVAVKANAKTEVAMAAKKVEPRLIVEALLVRKLSLEEAYLDFGGFALVG